MIRNQLVSGKKLLSLAIIALMAGLMTVRANAQSTAPAVPPASQPAPPLPPQHDADRQAKLDRIAEVSALNISRTHGDQFWRQHQALQADFEIAITGQPALTGTMILETKRDRARLNFKDGTTVLYDGSEAHLWPSDAKIAAPLFHVRCWPTLLAAPFRFFDPSINATSYKRRPLGDELLGSYMLTPNKKFTDPPIASAVAFYDPKSIRMRAVAIRPSNAAPPGLDALNGADHLLVSFSEYQTVQSTLLASSWSIRSWRDEPAPLGEPLAQVTIANMSFITPATDTFTPASGARRLAEGQ